MDLQQLFRQAVTKTNDTRGMPATLGRLDGTVLFTDESGVTHFDRHYVLIGQGRDKFENVAFNRRVAPNWGTQVKVDMVDGRLTVLGEDEGAASAFAGGVTGGTMVSHWTPLHARLGSDPGYIEGLSFLPLQAHPTSPPSLAVTVEQGSYEYGGAYKIFEKADSASLSGYVPGSGSHFVIVCLDRENNTIAIVDGADIDGNALFDEYTLSVDDVLAVTIPEAYRPLAAIVLKASTTQILAINFVMDLRPWGGASSNAGAGFDVDSIMTDADGGVMVDADGNVMVEV